jgi:membrane protease YdiL (CAAX protease family)
MGGGVPTRQGQDFLSGARLVKIKGFALMSNTATGAPPVTHAQLQAHAGTAAVPLAPATQPDAAGLMTLIVGVWAIVGLMIAYMLRVFQRDSIRGPERLRGDESVWWLMMILCGGYLIAGWCSTLFSHLGSQLGTAGHSLVTAGIGELLIFVAVVGLSVYFRKDALRQMGLRLGQLPLGIAGGIVTLFVLFPLVCLCEFVVDEIYRQFHLKQAEAHELLQLMGKTHDHRVVVIAIAMAAIVAPVLEELIFRGMIQTMFGRMFSFAFGPPRITAEPIVSALPLNIPSQHLDSNGLEYQSAPAPKLPSDAPPIGHRARWAAVVMTSAIFAAIHIEPAFMPPIFVLALGLGYVYERTGNMWMNITAHSLFNSVQILIFFYFH